MAVFLLLIFTRRELCKAEKTTKRVDARSRRVDGSGWCGSMDDDAIGRFAKCALEEKPLLIISYEAYRAHADRIQAIRDVGLLI